METKKLIKEFLNRLPEIEGAVAYGSGVFKQIGYDNDTKPGIDLIVFVDDLHNWHKKNYKLNKNDYSLIGGFNMRYMPKKMIETTTGTAYIAGIKYKERDFKIGVIEEQRAINDLLTWEHGMFLPGRMQKPILEIDTSQEMKLAIIKNRQYAINAAKLLSKKRLLTEEELYEIICNLSYAGDVRMRAKAENPNKVKNIVNEKQTMEFFRENYKGLYELENNLIDTSDTVTPWFNMPLHLLMEMPIEDIERGNEINKLEEIIKQKATYSSIDQAAKGIYTVGPVESVKTLIKKKQKNKTAQK